MAHELILGGVRSGKTALAERTALTLGQIGSTPVVYVATATPGDDEMARRIAAHQAQRPEAWGLIEEPVYLSGVLASQAASAPCLLVDCMSLWLSNLLALQESARAAEVSSFVSAFSSYPGDVVVVSNEIGLGVIGMDPLTRQFADELGWLNQRLAEVADRVSFSVAGLPMVLKG